LKQIKRVFYIYLVLAIVYVFILALPLILLFFGINMNSSTIIQARNELYPEMILTTLIISGLLGIGLVIDNIALRGELKNTLYHQREKIESTWYNNFWQGISTELIGAAFTGILFSLVLVYFQHTVRIDNDKHDIIFQMRSPNNILATEAVRIARNKGWLVDGSFERISLPYAQFNSIDLSQSHFSKSNFWGADLQYAIFDGANLSQAQLIGADLRQASLIGANLQGTFLGSTKLQGAIMWGADMRGANLLDAKLNDENIWSNEEITSVDTAAILPDGTKWSPNVDMQRFTNSEHPEFQSTLKLIDQIRQDFGMREISTDYIDLRDIGVE